MKRTLLFFLVILVVLLAGAWAPTAARAEPVTVTMSQPRMVDDDTAELSGVANRRSVQIQRKGSGVWLTFRWVRTDTKGRYRLTVGATTTPRRYRAVVSGIASEVRTVVAAAPVVEPLAPSDDCGPQPLKADGSRWACTLGEDFNGPELDRTIWRPATGDPFGTASTGPCYLDDPSVLSVQDGTLRLSVRELASPAPCAATTSRYVAGAVDTYRLFSQQYGRFEARFKSTATTDVGLHEAFWLWPDDRYNKAIWPAAGEIDIAETYSQYPDLAIPFLHYTWYDNWGPVPGLNTAWNCAAPRGVYNTYTLEWTATRLAIQVNGKTCLVNTSADPAFQKPYILALTQLMGVGANTYDGRAPMPATMTVDYVRVWS